MATNRYTIIFEEEDGKRYKLCRILLTRDGSYFVTCPYHPSEKVFLYKRRVNYANSSKIFNKPYIECAMLNDDDHRIKLSHHPDGFVQFSGDGIISGRNPDGSPKGIGLQSWPLRNPTAGPACGVTISKPTAFKEAEAPSKEDVIFYAADLYRAEKDNGVVIEMYYFPATYRRFVRKSSHGLIIWLNHPAGMVLELRVCMSPQDNWEIGFLGVDLWPVSTKLGESDSGFSISSPTGNLARDSKGDLEGDAIYAMYPALTANTPMRNLVFQKRVNPPYTKHNPTPSED
jgi:hypothetical protein